MVGEGRDLGALAQVADRAQPGLDRIEHLAGRVGVEVGGDAEAASLERAAHALLVRDLDLGAEGGEALVREQLGQERRATRKLQFAGALELRRHRHGVHWLAIGFENPDRVQDQAMRTGHRIGSD